MTRSGERIDWIQARIINPRTRQPIVLDEFQTRFIEGLYASTTLEAGFSLPRKNGKTGLLAALALAELDLNPDADVVLGATKVKQASRPSGVFGVMKTYCHLNQAYFGDRMKVSRNNNEPVIRNLVTNCMAEAVSMADEDAAQGLNPSLAILDEFGTSFWTPERWGAVSMSMGGRGTDSRVVGISTPSSQLSSMYALRCQVLAGTADRSLYWQEHSAPLDLDPYDPETWRLANPALGTFLDISSLEKDRNLPEYLFRLFRLGQWVDTQAIDGWLGLDGPARWDDGIRAVEFDRDQDVFLGVDKSAYDDSSAVVAVQRHGNDWLAIAKIYVPSPTIDHAAIKDDIRAWCRDFKVRVVGFDDRYFVEGAAELEDEGLPMVKIPQQPVRLAPVYDLWFKLIQEGRFLHQDDDAYRLHVLGAVPVHQTTGGFTLAKSKSRTKIDAAVATCIALAGANAYEPEPDFGWLIR